MYSVIYLITAMLHRRTVTSLQLRVDQRTCYHGVQIQEVSSLRNCVPIQREIPWSDVYRLEAVHDNGISVAKVTERC